MITKKINFIHIITTRFNVPTKIWTKTREGDKPLSEDWLKDRFEIFQKYCLPSFKNQSNENFIWLVFFDKEIPQEYKIIIDQIKKDFPKFIALFVQDFEDMQIKALEIIPSFYTTDTKFVITTDIDNDDLLHRDFVKTVQDHYEPRNNLVIDLKRGLQLTHTPGKKALLNVFYMVANPFISLVEDKNKVGTVMKEEHLKYRTYPNYTSYDAEPRFIQFIHANNLVNNTKYGAKRIRIIDFSDYGISIENYFKISATSAIIKNILRKKNLVANLFK